MKVIIFENIEQFEQLENNIHQALKIISEYPENTDKYADPIYSVDGSKIALSIEKDGIRGRIIGDIIQDFDIVEIQNTDPFWFNQEIFNNRYLIGV